MAKKTKKKAKSKSKRVSKLALAFGNKYSDLSDQIADLDRRVTRLEEHCGFKQPEPEPPQESADAPPPSPAPAA